MEEVIIMETNLQHYLNYQYPDTRVLYVEDENFSREKLLRVLNRRFKTVHVAIDGEEGYQLYQQYQPDLIIADIKMNQMGGLEMIEKIRKLDNKVQVIVTTSHDDNEFFIQSIENNVNHFILKPIDLDHLLLAIQKSVYQIQLEKELTKQKKLTRAILDYQDNLIFVIENGEIVEFNEAFSTFTGFAPNQVSLHKGKLLGNYFVKDPNYFYPKDKGKWVEELLARGKNFAKVRWKGHKEKDVIYFLKAGAIPDTNQLLFICTDITALEEESRRNEQLAMLDPLTNCYNRLKFEEILENEIRRAKRYEHPFSIIMINIDFFRNVNDCFGQKAGDEALITISTIVQQRIRESDAFARWGGEEFILLLPETDGQGGKCLAESIRSLVADFHFSIIDPVTCSFGVAEFSSGKSKKELIVEVNQALNQSKNNGQNLVTIYNKEC
jgi:two-component system cell cycle response regulator